MLIPEGSAAARLTRLFELHEQKMYRMAYAILHDEGLAEDAVMAAFEGIVRSGKTPWNPASKRAERLVFAAVRNAAIDQYRRNARERQRVQPMTQDALDAATPTAGPEQAAVAQAGFDALIEPLRAPHQDVLRERFGRGSSVGETAARLGISEAAVRKRQQRAIEQIRSMKGTAHD